jgi:hypothetical protein
LLLPAIQPAAFLRLSEAANICRHAVRSKIQTMIDSASMFEFNVTLQMSIGPALTGSVKCQPNN